MFSDESVTLAGRITELKTIPGKQRNRVEVRITDGTGWARITWFNPFVAKQLAVGDEIVVHGTLDEFRGRSLADRSRVGAARLGDARSIPVDSGLRADAGHRAKAAPPADAAGDR